MEDLKERIKEELIKLQTSGDTEYAHEEADRLLCSLLDDLGCEAVVVEFLKIEKWYA